MPLIPRQPLFDPYEHEAYALARVVVSRANAQLLSTSRLGLGGQLPNALVEVFARTLGLDVSRVRVTRADTVCDGGPEQAATAFAHGAEIHFVRDGYRPETRPGLALLAHEVVHVAQQGALPERGAVQLRTGRRVQCASGVDPSKIYGLCPPGTVSNSYPSAGPLGTAFGQHLGLMYRLSRPPDWYLIADWYLWLAGEWAPGKLSRISDIDPRVGGALAASEWTRGFLAWRERADILDADRSQVYEIKPVRSRADGPPQLGGYLTALNTLAAQTPAGTKRTWAGGDWDPRPYPMVVPGVGGKTCFIHAWRDETTPGLLVYDVVCCVPQDPQPGDQPVLVKTSVKQWEQHLDALRPPVEAVLQAILPKAPVGSTYAVLVPWRFFAAFVLPQWDIEMDRKLEKAFTVKPNPALVDLILGTWAASQALPTRDLTNLLWMTSPWMNTKQLRTLYKAQFAVELAVGTLVVGFAAAPLLADAAAASAVAQAGAADVVVADTSALGPLAADETLVAGAEGPAEGSLLNTGELAEIGASRPPTNLGPPPSPPPAGLPAGLGLLGVMFAGAVTTNADAAANNTPTGTPKSTPIGSDAVHLAPVELLRPYRGRIAVDAKVEYGGQDYVIVGIVTAEAGQ